MLNITILTSQDCRDSLQMKRLLKEANIEFEEKDASASGELGLHAKKTPVMLREEEDGRPRVVSDILTQLKLINDVLIERRNCFGGDA